MLAPTCVTVTGPPGRSSPVLEPGRVAAGHIHWAMKGGFVAISVYLKDGEGMKGGNMSTIWRLTEYLHELNSKGHNWIVAGDFNMPFEELNAAKWVGRVRGNMKMPDAPTCRKDML